LSQNISTHCTSTTIAWVIGSQPCTNCNYGNGLVCTLQPGNVGTTSDRAMKCHRLTFVQHSHNQIRCQTQLAAITELQPLALGRSGEWNRCCSYRAVKQSRAFPWDKDGWLPVHVPEV